MPSRLVQADVSRFSIFLIVVKFVRSANKCVQCDGLNVPTILADVTDVLASQAGYPSISFHEDP